ncbi:MAG: hypothetical protein CMO80_08945 [Verrucomicrobiales bacterium]|nr:hypothetical protein [Verrucomicrobiales bacterium]|tara:strand:+ start:3740 stop:4330 length:591 start_codon:yes stop_codon:yes gene_type:complete
MPLSIFRVSCVLLIGFGAWDSRAEHKAYETDLLIVGATESGWAAAIQAARMGVTKIMIVHDGKWFGGQFTEQALACVDENKGVGRVGWGVAWHPMKRSFHRSGLFKELKAWQKNIGARFPSKNPNWNLDAYAKQMDNLNRIGIPRRNQQHAAFLNEDFVPRGGWWQDQKKKRAARKKKQALFRRCNLQEARTDIEG